jgi:hypothetical protein
MVGCTNDRSKPSNTGGPSAGGAAAIGSGGTHAANPPPAGTAGTSGNHAGTGGSSGGTGGASGSGGRAAIDSGMMPTLDAGPNGAGNDTDAAPMTDAAVSSQNALLIPDSSWTCGMPDGIPPPALGQLAFEVTLDVGDIHDLGQTQYGARERIDVASGKVHGDKIDADVLDNGIDYPLTLATGGMEVEDILMLQAMDGTLIYLRVCGVGANADDVRVVPDFEAPTASAFAWLNDAKLAGTRALDRAGKKLTLRVYDVASVAAPAQHVTVTEPANVPDQTWDCATPSGTAGATVYMESVGIGDSLAVGDSKRGTRNVIPITGGTTTGMVAGGVLPGGGDYQLIGASFELDARYTLKTDDGELIIVRNCGPVGALVPVFETRKDGKYAWLNTGPWLSSDPGVGVGVVNLTIYSTM